MNKSTEMFKEAPCPLFQVKELKEPDDWWVQIFKLSIKLLPAVIEMWIHNEEHTAPRGWFTGGSTGIQEDAGSVYWTGGKLRPYLIFIAYYTKANEVPDHWIFSKFSRN